MNNLKDGENYIIMSFLMFINSLDWLWGLPRLLFNGLRSYTPGRRAARGMMLTIPLHLVQNLRINGATPLLSLYAIMTCAGTIFTVVTLRLLN
jgi:hypothetical protein